MADDKTVTTYNINVDTGDSAASAESAAEALDKMRDAMKANNGELAAMKQALSNFKKAGAEFKGQADEMRLAVQAKQTQLGQMQQAYLKLGGLDAKRIKPPKVDPPIVPQPKQPKPAELSTFAQVMKQLHTSVMQSDTSFGRLVTRMSKFTGEMSKSKLLVIGFTVALVAAAAAAAVWTKRITETAIAAQDARRNELLHFEALTRVRNLYGLPPNKSKEMQEAVDRIAPTVSIARTEVTALATQLNQAGLRGKRFETVLEAASIKASALGTASGSAFAGFAAAVHLAGGSAARAAQDIKNRFGDVVQSKLKSLEVQALKVKENIDSLFTGLDIDPLLDAKKAWNDMFSVATSTGRAFRSLATGFLQPILDASTTGLVFVRRFFKQMLIGALELAIVFRQLELWYKRALGGPAMRSAWGAMFTALQPGRVLVYALALAFGVLAVNVIAATWPFVLGAVAVWGLVTAVNGLYTLWKEIDWSELGSAVWQGIVNGLKKGWTAIKSVASDLADELQRAFKTALLIQSPSKVFAELGLQIPRGLKQGIEAGAPDANRAAADMVKPSNIGAAPPAAVSGGGSKTLTVTIQTINVTPASGAPADVGPAVRQSVQRELESLLANLAEQLGAPRGAAA